MNTVKRLFTAEQIQEIKKLEGFLTQKEIAKLYHTDRRRIGEIFNGTYCNRAAYDKIDDGVVEANYVIVPTEIEVSPSKINFTYWSNT